MRKQRHNYTPEEKVTILRRHLIDQVPISDLCDEYQLQPKLFYDWQKQFFEQGTVAFTRQSSSVKAAEAVEIQQLREKLQRTEERLQRKHEVLSELIEEHVKLKKDLGEPLPASGFPTILATPSLTLPRSGRKRLK
jgi:transposase-like protein